MEHWLTTNMTPQRPADAQLFFYCAIGMLVVLVPMAYMMRAATYRKQGFYTFSRTTILGTLLAAVLSGDKSIGPNLMKAAMAHDDELSAELPTVTQRES